MIVPGNIYSINCDEDNSLTFSTASSPSFVDLKYGTIVYMISVEPNIRLGLHRAAEKQKIFKVNVLTASGILYRHFREDLMNTWLKDATNDKQRATKTDKFKNLLYCSLIP